MSKERKGALPVALQEAIARSKARRAQMVDRQSVTDQLAQKFRKFVGSREATAERET
jgi:hypothetical protein